MQKPSELYRDFEIDQTAEGYAVIPHGENKEAVIHTFSSAASAKAWIDKTWKLWLNS